jgi:hypothetical protein
MPILFAGLGAQEVKWVGAESVLSRDIFDVIAFLPIKPLSDAHRMGFNNLSMLRICLKTLATAFFRLFGLGSLPD